MTMFSRYVRSRRSSSLTKFSTFQLFRSSKFYVSILLITSFTTLVVIPFLLLCVARKHLGRNGEMICELITYASDPLDFFIYAFIYDPVYEWIKQRVNGIITICKRKKDLVEQCEMEELAGIAAV